MTKFSTTKEVVYHIMPHVQGRVLDLGAGMAKYKGVIKENALDYIS